MREWQDSLVQGGGDEPNPIYVSIDTEIVQWIPGLVKRYIYSPLQKSGKRFDGGGAPAREGTADMAGRGRPRTFDRDEVLRKALLVFWERGYQNTSMADLTAAMGINSPSLYAAYGSKEKLFREALALYSDTEGVYTRRALAEQPTARAAVEVMMRDNAAAYTDPTTPRGCLVVLAAPIATPDNPAIPEELARHRAEVQHAVRARIQRGIAEGDVPAEADPDALAAFYATVLNGLSLQARDGATLDTLQVVVDNAMTAWPAPPRRNPR
jgi:AcrR family transcriptional regulator